MGGGEEGQQCLSEMEGSHATVRVGAASWHSSGPPGSPTLHRVATLQEHHGAPPEGHATTNGRQTRPTLWHGGPPPQPPPHHPRQRAAPTSSLFTSSSPMLLASPTTMLSTPRGMPARSASSARARAVSGVSSLGFSTTCRQRRRGPCGWTGSQHACPGPCGWRGPGWLATASQESPDRLQSVATSHSGRRRPFAPKALRQGAAGTSPRGKTTPGAGPHDQGPAPGTRRSQPPTPTSTQHSHPPCIRPPGRATPCA